MSDSEGTLPHDLRMINQIRRLPTGLSETGWADHESTGMVHLTCNCGYSTGWIPRDQVPDREKTRAEHPGRLYPV